MKIDHVYCVNLARSIDRKTHMMMEFERENIDAEIFPATDGRTLGRDGTYGCAMSHLRVWRDIVANKYQNALVFEDDIQLTPDINNFIEDIIEPDEWDIIYLYKFGPIYKYKYNEKLYRGKTLSTAGYIISAKCANRLHLLEPDDMGCGIDEFIVSKLNLKTFIVKGNLVHSKYDLQLRSTIGINIFRAMNISSFQHWFEYFKIIEIIFIILIIFLLVRLGAIRL